MRAIILVELLFAFSANLHASDDLCDADSVVIYYADWSVVTGWDISCSDFIDIAQRKYVIADRTLIQRLHEEILSAESSSPLSLDVRCKMLFYKGKKHESVCFDQISFLFGGRLFKLSDKFMSLINDIVDNYYWTKPEKQGIEINKNIVVGGKKTIVKRIIKVLKDLGNIVPDKSNNIIAFCKSDVKGNTIAVTFSKNTNCITPEIEDEIKAIIINPNRSLDLEMVLSLF